jgi:hypothetical protein
MVIIIIWLLLCLLLWSKVIGLSGFFSFKVNNKITKYITTVKLGYNELYGTMNICSRYNCDIVITVKQTNYLGPIISTNFVRYRREFVITVIVITEFTVFKILYFCNFEFMELSSYCFIFFLLYQ